MTDATMLVFVVPGPCVPKERPRVMAAVRRCSRCSHPQPGGFACVRCGGKLTSGYAHAMTPPRTKAYAEKVKAYAYQEMAKRRLLWTWPKNATYRIDVRCYQPDERRRDGDNVLKAITDPLTGLCWEDDSFVRDWHVEMLLDRERPRTVVTITVWQPTRR